MNTSSPDVADLSAAGLRVLDAASELFYMRGIAAVGVDLIAEHSGVTKRTLYNVFGSKEALVATYLRARDDRWRARVIDAVNEAGRSPRERLLAPFRVLADWMRENSRGCAMVNALSELPADHPARAVAVEEKRWLLALFEEHSQQWGDGRLGAQLFTLHEGALAMQSALPEAEPAAHAMRAAETLVANGHDARTFGLRGR